MALFYECMLQCAQKALDTADIVRDGDFSPIETGCPQVPRITSCLPTIHSQLAAFLQSQGQNQQESAGRPHAWMPDDRA
jgi:hypothetical protein